MVVTLAGLVRLAVAVGALLTGMAAGAGAGETWTVASEENFPPYNYTADGRRTGLDTEIVEAVLGRIGVTPDHRPAPWSRVVHDVDQNQTDLAFQFVGKPERFEAYNMVGPHRAGLTVFAVRADSGIAYDTLADLGGKRIGTVQGFAYTPEFDGADFLEKEPVANNTLNIRKLAAGRLDVVIGDLHTLASVAREEKVSAKIRFLPKPLSEVPRYIAFPKARKEKAERFAKALAELQ
ncbi:substrate-binding periplasmic protein, partial [Azospirillum sp. A39]